MWQLAYNLESNYLEHIEENAAMVKQKRDQLDDNIHKFNQTVTRMILRLILRSWILMLS